MAEVALTGRAPGLYNLYLGGGFHGQRLNSLYAQNLSVPKILATLDSLLERYANERNVEEGFGDYLFRTCAPAVPVKTIPLQNQES